MIVAGYSVRPRLPSVSVGVRLPLRRAPSTRLSFQKSLTLTQDAGFPRADGKISAPCVASPRTCIVVYFKCYPG